MEVLFSEVRVFLLITCCRNGLPKRTVRKDGYLVLRLPLLTYYVLSSLEVDLVSKSIGTVIFLRCFAGRSSNEEHENAWLGPLNIELPSGITRSSSSWASVSIGCRFRLYLVLFVKYDQLLLLQVTDS